MNVKEAIQRSYMMMSLPDDEVFIIQGYTDTEVFLVEEDYGLESTHLIEDLEAKDWVFYELTPIYAE